MLEYYIPYVSNLKSIELEMTELLMKQAWNLFIFSTFLCIFLILIQKIIFHLWDFVIILFLSIYGSWSNDLSLNPTVASVVFRPLDVPPTDVESIKDTEEKL